MRYRLRTLLILLAVVPPVVAGIAWLGGLGSAGPFATAVAIYVVLAVLLAIASKTIETKRPTSPQGVCSFCLKGSWPLAEGPSNVLICRDCAVSCLKLMDEKTALREEDRHPKEDPRLKPSWPADSKTNPVKAK